MTVGLGAVTAGAIDGIGLPCFNATMWKSRALSALSALAALASSLGCASSAESRGTAMLESAFIKIDPERPFPESSFAVVDGLKIHYRVFSPGAAARGNPIMLVHGVGGSTYTYRYQIPALTAAGKAFVLVDFPPFGYSDKSKEIGRAGYDRGELFWHLVDAELSGLCPPGAKWDLVGHSMGGAFVAAMALERPEGVGRLVIIDGAVHVGGPPDILTKGFLRGPVLSFVTELVGNLGMLDGFQATALGRRASDEELLGYVLPYCGETDLSAFLDWAAMIARAPKIDPRPIRAPTLLIWGDRDPIIPLAEGRRLRAEIEGSRLEVVEGAAHLPCESHPDAVNALLLGFFE